MLANNKPSDMNCAMYGTNGMPSFAWRSMSIVSFAAVTLLPVQDMLTPEQTYIFTCQNTIVPSVYVAPIVQLM